MDRATELLAAATRAGTLVNFGGDLRARPRSDGRPWRVGIESPSSAGEATALLEIHEGALATSGDGRRYVQKDGVRYSHILDPRTGWPVPGAPRSVTVLAASCTEAGMLATLALLGGPDAEAFLRDSGARHWCIR